MAEEKKVAKKVVAEFIATGRRKSSVARVRMKPGKGVIKVNDKEIGEYLQRDTLLLVALQPLELTQTRDKFDIRIKCDGGGIAGQAGAICHGLARALVKVNETYKAELKKAGFLTRDPRMKERKKYGLKKARKAPQFSKR